MYRIWLNFVFYLFSFRFFFGLRMYLRIYNAIYLGLLDELIQDISFSFLLLILAYCIWESLLRLMLGYRCGQCLDINELF